MKKKLRRFDIMLGALIAAFILVAGLLVWVLSLSSVLEQPAPASDAWSRIEARGTIIIGTSADYPPFESYDGNFQLDGFDMALIREIGQRLGLQVEIRDMVFDDLGNALNINQIDAAISAISVTSEREQVVDFSNIYFVSEDGVLARQDSTITTINTLTDMIPYRVGVQTSSVYQNEIEQKLIQTGLMPADRLYRYTQADTAIADLKAERIDLVWLDLQPAQVAQNSGGVGIVGQGLSRQRMAIAMNNGETALQTKLNEALTALQNEGRVAQLVLDYMEIPPDQIIPPPTPAPSATPVPTATPRPCTDGLRLVADLNLDDNNMQNPPQMPPGVPFQKGWRLQNTGTCTWDNTYYLGYVGGNTAAARMGGQPTPVNGPVAPGAMVDLWVDLVTPLVPGVYQGFWAMHNGRDVQFGDRIWVGIEVVGAPTATPPPTQTPSPNISFSADRTNIQAGECVLFSWDVQGATTVYFHAEGQPWQPNQVASQASRTECPPQTTTYFLRVIWPDGRLEVREITIVVQPNVAAPVIERFTLYPPNEIFFGQCVEITWLVSGQVSGVTLLRDDEVLNSNAPVSGTLTDCPDGNGFRAYALVANGPGGSSRQQQHINIILPVTEPPPATATPEIKPPSIDAFAARPEKINAGECVDISWSVSGDATLIQLKRDGIVVLDNAGYSGIVQDCLANAGTVVYRIDASNTLGDFVFQDAVVQVLPVDQPDLPLVGTTWILTEFGDGQGGLQTVLSGTAVNAEFGADSQVIGTAGCNSYRAAYTLFTIEGSISIEPPTATNQQCGQPPGIMEQEQRYLTGLPIATTYQISGSIMEMRDNSGQLLFRYDAAVAVPLSP